MQTPTKKQVLIVDDDPSIGQFIRRALLDEAQFHVACSGEEAVAAFHAFKPAIVLLDVSLPDMDGYETCRRLKQEPDFGHTQIIMITSNSSEEDLQLAFAAGADDYLVKPIDPMELRSRIRLLSRLQQANHHVLTGDQQIARYDRALKQLSQSRTSELLAAQDVTVFALAKLAELRDTDTGGHLLRMRSYSIVLAEELKRAGPYSNRVDIEFIAKLYRSSPLHDVGKVGIPDEILLKPGKLTADEINVMKTHTTIGADVLQEASNCSTGGGFLKMAVEIARYHHERFDGSGYPEGLKGNDIPLSARIVAVADVFDALTSKRPYKKAFSHNKARAIIENESGKQFDPVIVQAFRNSYPQFLEILVSNTPLNHETAETPPQNDVPNASRSWIYSSFADDEFFEELIEEYVNALPDRVEQLKELFAQSRTEELSRLVHQLKGSAGSYGFDQITPIASTLEEVLQSDGESDSIQTLLDDLVSICSRVRVKEEQTANS